MQSSSVQSPNACKTEHAFDIYWYCLANKTSFCFHRFAYRDGQYCMHYDKEAFRDRAGDCTKEVEQK